MPTLKFKAKLETVYNMDDTVAYQCVRVPAIERRHCDMSAFRSDRKIGPYANSDLFPALLKRELRRLGIGEYIRLDEVPAGVSVDTSSFLASVTITLGA